MPLIIYKGEVVLTIMIFKKLQKGADKGHKWDGSSHQVLPLQVAIMTL